jgi:2-iminobutanoate/2-iminopropanoate deaminase
MRRTAVLVFALLASACATSPAHPVLEFRPDPSSPSAPFSRAVRVGNLLFLSGQIGTDASGRLVSGGIQPETQQTLENVRAILAQNGLGMDRVAKCTVFLADMAEWGKMNELYVTFFPGQKPARSALGTNGLAYGARVEIECIAAIE